MSICQITQKFKLLTFLGKQYLPPSRKSQLLMIIYLLNLYEWPVFEEKTFKSYISFGHHTKPLFEFLNGYFGSINNFTNFRNRPKVNIILFSDKFSNIFHFVNFPNTLWTNTIFLIFRLININNKVLADVSLWQLVTRGKIKIKDHVSSEMWKKKQT